MNIGICYRYWIQGIRSIQSGAVFSQKVGCNGLPSLFITPHTQILSCDWFRTRHMICLIFTRKAHKRQPTTPIATNVIHHQQPGYYTELRGTNFSAQRTARSDTPRTQSVVHLYINSAYERVRGCKQSVTRFRLHDFALFRDSLRIIVNSQDDCGKCIYCSRSVICYFNTVCRIYVWGVIKQILTAFTRAMVKTMTPSVIP